MVFSPNLDPLASLQYNGYTPLGISQMGYTTPNPVSTVAPSPVTVPLSNPVVSTSGSSPVDIAGIAPALMKGAAYGAANVVGLDNTNSNIPNVPLTGAAATGAQDGNWLTNTFLNKEGGLNLNNITSILGTLGGLYGSFQQLGLAKDALNFQKDTYRENMTNQKKSYNTAVRDRADSRAAGLGWSDAQRDEYVNRNRL